MEYGQEAHPPSVGRTGKAGTHRNLPFKGCVRDDLPVPPAMDDKGWQRGFQPVHPQTKGKDRTALNAAKGLTGRFAVFPLFLNLQAVWQWFANPMANVRVEWRGASALSCEICRGITAFGQ